ncbi:MAG: hypothetical protein IKC75_08035 [Clostridia bacterium]|nr:hypothetical protein [Clostridia bacterium]
MSKLRLMSQNQWYWSDNRPEWQALGLDSSAAHRMHGHIQVFKDLMPDVVGGQEITPEMQQYFHWYAAEDGLDGYAMIWGNYTPIFYRTDRLDLVAAEYVRYPKEIEGLPKTYNDISSKGATVGVFRTKEDGKMFIFLTTHLWFKRGNPAHPNYYPGSNEARAYQLRMAKELIEKYRRTYGNIPSVYVGDLNAGSDYEDLLPVMYEDGYTHAHDLATDFATEDDGYNTMGVGGPGQWRHLHYLCNAYDHIVVKDFPEGSIKRFDRYMPDYYLYLSDHAPVYIDVEL